MSPRVTNKVSRRQLFSVLTHPGQRTRAEPNALTGVLKKIVFAYDKTLPAGLVLAAEQLRGKVQEAGLKVAVVYHPLSSLPQDTDLLLVSEALVRIAQQRAPEVPVIPLKQYVDNRVYDDLVTRLLAKDELRVEGEDATEPTTEPKILRYRGYQKID